MKKIGLSFATVLLLLSSIPLQAKEAPLSDAAIAQRLIDDSIAAYPGNCPCPYNTARNGSRCGKRSAYNRPGGYAPLCFKEDVTKAMIQEYRGRVKGYRTSHPQWSRGREWREEALTRVIEDRHSKDTPPPTDKCSSLSAHQASCADAWVSPSICIPSPQGSR